VKASDHTMESKRSRPLRFGKLARVEACDDCVPDGSSSSDLAVNRLDSSLCRIRVRVSGGSLVVVVVTVAATVIVLAARLFAADCRLKGLARDGGLLLVAEEEIGIELLSSGSICSREGDL